MAAPNAASAAGAGAQNVPSPPSAAHAEAGPVLGSAAASATDGALIELATVTPPTGPVAVKSGEAPGSGVTVVPGDGGLAVRVLSSKAAPRPSNDAAARATAGAPAGAATPAPASPARAADPVPSDIAPAEPSPPPPVTIAAAVPAPGPAASRTLSTAEPAPATQAPLASPGPAATTARGEGAQAGGDQGSAGNRREREAAASAQTADDAAPAPTPPTPDAAQGTRAGAPVASRGDAVAVASPALGDPRLEPMRRAADQVTLKFEGEDGLEGRLRISVRGDTVRASILSSSEGTLQRLGGELGTLRRALSEQGFNTTRVAVHDTRTTQVGGAAEARQYARGGEERRQGEPQRRSGQGRESRQESGAEQGRRGPREERRTQ